NVPNRTDLLFIDDSCKSGGFYGGNNPPGDIENLKSSYLIASAREDQNAPLNSILTPNLVTFLNTGSTSSTSAQIGAAIGYAGLTFTGGRRDNLSGEGELNQIVNQISTVLTDEPFDSFANGNAPT